MPSTRDPLTSASCVVFGVFALSASGLVGDPDVPLLVLVGLVALVVAWTFAAKRWHAVRATLSRNPPDVVESDAQDLIRMGSDKG